MRCSRCPGALGSCSACPGSPRGAPALDHLAAGSGRSVQFAPFVPDDLDQAQPLESGHALLTDPVAELAVGRVQRNLGLHRKTPVASKMRDGVLRESRLSGGGVRVCFERARRPLGERVSRVLLNQYHGAESVVKRKNHFRGGLFGFVGAIRTCIYREYIFSSRDSRDDENNKSTSPSVPRPQVKSVQQFALGAIEAPRTHGPRGEFGPELDLKRYLRREATAVTL